MFLLDGCCICYGSSKTLLDKFAFPCGDFAAYKPRTLYGVPRIFETLKKGTYATVHSKATPKWKTAMFDLAFEVKKRCIRAGFKFFFCFF